MRSGGRAVNNFSESTPPCRSLKGFRVRKDYQRRYDVLAARVKHTQGKEELIGKALGVRKALPASCSLTPCWGKGTEGANRKHGLHAGGPKRPGRRMRRPYIPLALS